MTSADFETLYDSRATASPALSVPTLSVIVPVFNTAPYLEDCLSSLTTQNVAEIEILLIDDGSTDTSGAVLLAFARKHPDLAIVLVRQPNRGLSAVRNLGLSLARGTYVAFLDSDDFLLPGAYAALILCAEETKADMVFMRSLVFDDRRQRTTPFFDMWIGDEILQGRSFCLTNARETPLVLALEPNVNTRLMRRRFIESLGLSYPGGKFYEDSPAHLDSCLAAARIGLLAQYGYAYRTQRPGKITDQRNRLCFDALDVMESWGARMDFSALSPSQSACVAFHMLRLLDRCGTLAPCDARASFYARAAGLFHRLPKACVKSFESLFFLSTRRQITFSALRRGDIALMLAQSANAPCQLRSFWHFARQGRPLFSARLRARQKACALLSQKRAHAMQAPPPWHEKKVFDSFAQTSPKKSALFAETYPAFLFNIPAGGHVLIFADEDSLLASYLEQTRNDLRLAVARTPDDLRTYTEKARRSGAEISLFACERTDVDLALIAFVLERARVRTAAGLFAAQRIAPMALYRLCRAKTKRFTWKESASALRIADKGSEGPEVEVSVIVPAYNVAACLPRCLESLAAQTIESLEVIVVDDGATDETGALAERQAARARNRFRVLHKPNGGCASARAAGLAAARGRFVGFVDADDWVDASMFEDLFAAAVLTHAPLSQGGFRRFFEETRVCQDQPEHFPLKDIPTPFGARVMNPIDLAPLQPTIWRRLYERSFLSRYRIGFLTSLPRFDDLPFQFTTFFYAADVAVIDRILYTYRLQRPGQDVTAKDARLFVHFPIFEALKKEIRETTDFHAESRLVCVQLYTHAWALSRLVPGLRRRYRRGAAHDLFAKRCWLRPFDVLRVAFQTRHGLFRLALGCFVLYALFPSALLEKSKEPPSS